MTTMGVVPPLAHAGEGATWQALLTLLALGLLIVVVLVAFGILTVDEPGDLILPLAGAAVLASLSGATSTVLSDWVGWAFPVGVVALVALLVASMTPLDLAWASPLLWGAVVVGVVGAVVLQGPIARAWHPKEVLQGVAVEDLEVQITSPSDGAAVERGAVGVTVEATGGTLGSAPVDAAETPADPEEAVVLLLSASSPTAGSATQLVEPQEDCVEGCGQATFQVTLDELGEWTIYVEALTADRQRFTVTPTDSVTVTVQ